MFKSASAFVRRVAARMANTAIASMNPVRSRASGRGID